MLRAAGSAETAGNYPLETLVSQEGFGCRWLVPGRDVRGYVIIAGTRARAPSTTLRAGPRHTNCYFFSEALFVFAVHDDGVSLHLRNAGTTSACSSVGSFRFSRVSLVRFAPAVYPIF